MQDIWSIGSGFFSDGLLVFVISASVIFLASHIVTCIIGKTIKRMDKTVFANISTDYLGRIIRAVIYLFATLAVLNQIKPLQGIGVAALSATGVVTVVMGLAAQETFGNFIAGFFLSLYQPFKTGDVIVLPEKGIAGTVTDITFRHTVLVTKEKYRVIVPNSIMNSAVIQDNAYGQEIFNAYITFSVAYQTDVELLKRVIYEEASLIPGILDPRSEQDKANNVPWFVIRIDDFLDSGIKVLFAIPVGSFGETFTVASQLRVALLNRFGKEGIEIPYNIVKILK